MAGLLVTVILVPQGMAYATLAGFPPVYGLFAAFIPLVVYPFFGSSRHLSVGPVALVSIMIYGGLSTMAKPLSPEFIQLGILTALIAGVIQIALAILRMGFLINFLSEPVIKGFTFSAGLIIILSQLFGIFGIKKSVGSSALELLRHLTLDISNIHLMTAVIGSSALALLTIVRYLKKTFPIGILVVILATTATYFFKLHTSGLAITADVPGGLPAIRYDFITYANAIKVLPLAFAICLISFIESLAIAQSINSRHRHPPIDANRELFALGLAKFVGSFFQAFPNTGSFSRSAVNDEAGAQSGLASLFAAAFIGLVLMFFTPLFYYLPKCILSAIVIAAVLSLIQVNYIKVLYQFDRKDFIVFMVTCLATFIFGIQIGVATGIAISIVMILRKSAKPHYAILGQLPQTRSFRNINRYKEAVTHDNFVVIRYDQDIYFGNAIHFHDTIINLTRSFPKASAIILNAGVISDIDSTGMTQLKRLVEKLNEKEISLYLTHVRGPVRDKLTESDVLKMIGENNLYLTVHDAVYQQENVGTARDVSINYASQSDKNKNTKSDL